MSTGTVVCDRCEEPLDDLASDEDERTPCPVCGSTNRRYTERIHETASATDDIGGVQISIREWIETNWPVLIAGVVLTGAGFLIGGPAGLAVGVVASVVGIWACTKVREREVDRF